MSLRSVSELKNIRGKRVLVRVDFNVPVERGEVADDTKIAVALPTLQLLLAKGAKVIIMTHLGKPNEKALAPVAKRFSMLLKRSVPMLEKWDFEKIQTTVRKMKSGDVFMLPNVRLHPGEKTNSTVFAKDLASLGDFYVNEAFPECHRKYASMVGVPKILSGYAGLRLVQEVETLSRVLHKFEKPLVVLMGGGKITDKMAMLNTMLKRADNVLLGGALATHLYKAMGCGVGSSHIEPEGVRLAKKLLGNTKIVLPKDVVVGTADGESARVVGCTEALPPSRRRQGLSFPKAICEKPDGIWDIGPQTILAYAQYIKNARTLVWNGPMGIYEVKRYSHGTLALGRLFASRSRGKAFGVIGGGETIDALNKTGLAEYVDFISTGGGAMLEFLSGKKLPGISALELSGRSS